MRALFDTNVLLSALLWSGPPYAPLGAGAQWHGDADLEREAVGVLNYGLDMRNSLRVVDHFAIGVAANAVILEPTSIAGSECVSL